MLRQTALLSLVALLLASLALADPVTLTGTVLGPDGKPMAGAQVLTLRLIKANDVKVIETTSDAAGAFSLQTDSFEWGGRGNLPLLARKSGFALAIGAGKPGISVTLTLGDKPQKRSGVLLTPDGKPLPAAPVSLYYLGDLGNMQGGDGPRSMFFFGRQEGWKTTTDAQGRFDFEGIPAGFTVAASVTIDGYASMGAQIADETPVTLKLQPEAMVSGRVTLKGQPLADAVVQGWVEASMTGAAVATTAADGTYTLRHLAAGQGQVTIAPAPTHVSPTRQPVTLTAGQTATGIDFDLSIGGLIKGKVTSTVDGKPVAEANVAADVASDAEETRYAQTKADGTYEMRLAPGKYVVYCTGVRGLGGPRMIAQTFGAKTDDPAGTVTLKDGDVIEGKDFTVKPPRKVQGQVLRPDGQPAVGIAVRGYGQNMWNQPVQMQEGGKFELTLPEPMPNTPGGLPPTPPNMPSLLIARDTDKNLCAILRADKLPDQITLTLQPAATAILPVVDPQGQPLPNIPVMAMLTDDRYGGFTMADAKTDAAGLARISALPPGLKLQFQVSWEMSLLVVTQATRDENAHVLKPGDELTLPPIVMDPKGRSLNVFVGDADGKPIRDAQVYAQNVQKPFVTDEQGKVTLTGLAMRGEIGLFAAHPTQDLFAAQVVDPDKDPWPGLLLKAPGQATGLLIDKEGGKPLAEVNVMAQPDGRRGGWWWIGQQFRTKLRMNNPGQQGLKTDADGRWKLDKLIPGVDYQLIVFTQTPEKMRSAASFAGTFKAEGGPDLQDIGIMEANMPKEGPGGPAGPAGVPPPPPPPAK